MLSMSSACHIRRRHSDLSDKEPSEQVVCLSNSPITYLPRALGATFSAADAAPEPVASAHAERAKSGQADLLDAKIIFH